MKEKTDLVSVIMPAYNASAFISEAIQSVIDQIHDDWELLIINDGSSDDTEKEILDFTDSRIKYFKQVNKGVGAARNLGLKKMSGDYFCFLDADDSYTDKSLSSRIEVFYRNVSAVFVDGATRVYDDKSSETIRIFEPSFKGICTNSLLSLSETCFLGQTWMIKVLPDVQYSFIEGQTHSEDITFLLSLAELGEYDYTQEFIMNYRIGHGSAMDDLQGLENGYFTYLSEAKRLFGKRKMKMVELRLRIVKIMFLSYLAHKDYVLAIKVLRRLFI